MTAIRQFTHWAGIIAVLMVSGATLSLAADDTNTSAEREKELLAILRSDVTGGEKALACKNLAIHGSTASVPDLAKLLPDPQLSSWARIALESIPGEAADEALREATASLSGKLLVGTINSIGVRRDASAVATLVGRLKDDDSQVASAAAVALGRIGNAEASKSLRQALSSTSDSVRSAVAEGCVLCAEQLLAVGESAAAVEIYDEVRAANVSEQRVIEATRGAILARNADGIPLLLEQFQSSDKAFFQLALGTAREIPGSALDKVLAAELGRTTPARAALIVQCMADRPDTVVLTAVLRAASEGPKEVRLSAIDALKRVGDESCLLTLLDLATGSDADLAQAGRETLAGLPGDKVNSQIVTLLPEAKGASLPLLLELVGQRRISAVPTLLKALRSSDKAVRGAALIALGETVTLKELSVLISQVVASEHPGDAELAQQALKAASVRMPDREACAVELAQAVDRAPTSTKNVLLEIIAEVGGAKALQTLGEAAKSRDPELQDTASRLLGKWNSVDAAPVLLDLATSAPADKFRVRALRGYIGLARKFAMPESQRAGMCRSAVDVSQRADEKKLVLDVLTIHPSQDGLSLAISLKQTPGLKDAATAATLAIAQKLGGKGIDVQKLLASAGLDKVKLEIVKAEYGAGASRRDVTQAVRKQAGDLPLITLASPTYNASFGGDPSPGVVKRLNIEYRINGKSGTASFAENDLIILPMPK
jgi:HEAT repeat protein